MKPVALGRKYWTVTESEPGGNSIAIPIALIESAKLNDVNPQAWLSWELGCIANHKIIGPNDVVPWSNTALAA
ncbi:transposase domain-containing protein [Tropicimonas sp. IMCC6043]|uniref:transposase domain-containing protein n=1 Tax=Tropicimonas sp. IMCC6043 TaxID=2510645 RepID=UPI00101D2D10|nr:transposase domain-containing protein [Tropicimonas sp. IMCC6043]RYH09159.1 transposase domain-containing protein [Tropicimonas sp. IMCC6043]